MRLIFLTNQYLKHRSIESSGFAAAMTEERILSGSKRPSKLMIFVMAQMIARLPHGMTANQPEPQFNLNLTQTSSTSTVIAISSTHKQADGSRPKTSHSLRLRRTKAANHLLIHYAGHSRIFGRSDKLGDVVLSYQAVGS